MASIMDTIKEIEANEKLEAYQRFKTNEYPSGTVKGVPLSTFKTEREKLAASQQKAEPALRFDAGKPRFELIPPDALEEVAKVYTFGAQKYDEHNWAKGMSWSRVVGSMLRHIFAWLAGEEHDVESKLHPMAHVAWGALTLIAYNKRKIGEDNRLKV